MTLRYLASGGEASIYTDGQYAYKIFNEKPNLKKLSLLKDISSTFSKEINATIPIKIIKFPKIGKFGYKMKLVSGVTLHRFLSKSFITENNITRLDLIDISIQILKSSITLHENGILLSDINLNNFLVHDKKVWLIDTCSWSFRGYTCDVGMKPFLSPRLRRASSLRDVPRNYHDEVFAINTLLFLIFHPLKSPFACKGEQSRSTHYPYPLQLKDYPKSKSPKGLWSVLHSNLPIEMRKAWYYTYNENSLITPHSWIKLLSDYRYQILEHGRTNKVFVNTFYYNPKYQTKNNTCCQCDSTFQTPSNKTYKLCPVCRELNIINSKLLNKN